MTTPAAPLTPPNGESMPHATVITPPRTIRKPPPVGERGQVKSQTYVTRRYLGDPNLEKLTSSEIAEMEKDPQVQAGIKIRELAILGKPGKFNYTPKNANDPIEVELGKRMVAFLEHVWAHLSPDPNRILRGILSARRYGFSVNELVWASAIGPTGEPEARLLTTPEFTGFATIDRIKHLPSSSFEASGFSTDEFGHLRYVFQNLAKTQRAKPNELPGVVLAPQDPTEAANGRIVFNVGAEGEDAQRLLIYVANPKDDGDYYGASDHKSAYAHWYSKQASLSGIDLLLDRMAGVLIGESEDPNSLSALETALDNAAAGSAITVPKESNVRILDGADGQVEAFLANVRYRDVQILRAYLVPNETVGGSDDASGSYARANSHLNSFFLSLGQIATELEEVIEEQFIRPLIETNFGPVETLPTFDFPDPADKDLELLGRVFDTAVRTGYADPLIDALHMRAEMGLPAAPEGHVFTKPQPSPDPFNGIFNAPPPGASGALRLAAARTEPAAPTLFETVDHHAAVAQSVDAHELAALSRLTRAVTDLRDEILANAPASAEDAERIVVSPELVRGVLDEIALGVMDDVRVDMARKFEQLDRAQPANALLAARTTPKRRLFGLLAARDDADPATKALRAYAAWSSALNTEIANREAASLQGRLRVRVIQAYASGMNAQQVAATLADEFASYVKNQLEAVVKTTVIDYYNSARNSAIDAAGDYVEGIKISGIRDAHQTPFCRAIHGRTIRKSDPLFETFRNMPYWYQCRDIPIPILRGENVEWDTDWAEFHEQHRNTEGGGFVYGKS